MTADKRARLEEIKYKRGGYAPMEGDNIGPTIDWLITEVEEAWAEVERMESCLHTAEKDAIYQHRHRKLMLQRVIQLRAWLREAYAGELAMRVYANNFRRRAEAAEAQRDRPREALRVSQYKGCDVDKELLARIDAALKEAGE